MGTHQQQGQPAPQAQKSQPAPQAQQTQMTPQAGKPRIVIDTNVMVGAMVAMLAPDDAKPCQHVDRRLFEYACKNFEVVFSRATMTELRNVAVDVNDKTRDLGPTRLFNRLQFVDSLQTQFKPSEPGRSSSICRDKNDQMFLDLAAGTKAQFIVTRDHDLLVLGRDGACRILHSKDFQREIMQPRIEAAHAAAKAAKPADKVADKVADKAARKPWRANQGGKAKSAQAGFMMIAAGESGSARPHKSRRQDKQNLMQQGQAALKLIKKWGM